MQISIDNIEKSYQGKLIFRNVTLDIQSNERLGISGLNGSGKSTFIKILAGFSTPNKGNIEYRLNEKPIKVENVYQYVSMAAPYIDIPTELTLYELFDFHFSVKRRWGNLTNVQINDYFQLPIHIPIHQFSSGMLQRVKLALAFFSDSQLLLLDEPTETLDEKGFQLYQYLLENFGHTRTILIASNKEKDFIACKAIIGIDQFKN